jgi:hypothetical protein
LKFQDIIPFTITSKMLCWHRSYNPSYSGGREVRRILVQSQSQANYSRDPILKKTHHKKGLVEWLNVWTLSSSPSIAKQANKQKYYVGASLTKDTKSLYN